MRRREFIVFVSGAAAWPLAPHAQQPAVPVIGFIGTESADQATNRVQAFLQGLNEAGYRDGRNVAIEYRWADGQNDRLRELAADLVRRQVSVIAANGAAALAAKAATSTIPVIFFTGGDPVEIGLVTSLNRPSGNVTGVTDMNVEVGSKRLELLRELVPATTVVALLVNPANPTRAETVSRDLQATTGVVGVKLHVLQASTDGDLEGVFARASQLKAGGIVIGADAFFASRSKRLGALAARYAVPTIFAYREFAAAGGLASYGSNNADLFRVVGSYAGRILKGERPADIPVLQATKVEMIINLKAAKALGLNVPLSLLGRADEVIE
jgi:putative ABC transport system substrate-binding protein